MPPSATSVVPVHHAESSVAKKITGPATSSGWPIRRRGVRRMKYSRFSGLDKSSRLMSVSTGPGRIALQLMPYGPRLIAIEAVSRLIPALVEQ